MNILSRYTFVSTYGKEKFTRQDADSNGISSNKFSKCDTDKDGIISIDDILANQEISQNVIQDIQSKIDKLTAEENIIKSEAEKINKKIDIKENNPFPQDKEQFSKDNIIDFISSNEYNNFIEKEKKLNESHIKEEKIIDDTPTKDDIISANIYKNFIDKEKEIRKKDDIFVPIIDSDNKKINIEDIIAESRRNFIEHEKKLNEGHVEEEKIINDTPTEDDIISANIYKNFIDKEKEIGKHNNIFTPDVQEKTEPEEIIAPDKKAKHKKIKKRYNDQLSKIEEKFKNNIPSGIKVGGFTAAM